MRYMMLIIILYLSGCTTFTSPARKHELDSSKSYWMDYDATRRGVILNTANSKWQYCAEPVPDAAIALVAKLEGSLNFPDNITGSGKAEMTQSVINLAEKTQMVMFLRESLFRLCEISINKDIDKLKIPELYNSVIMASVKLVELETAKTKLEQSRLESANRAQFIYHYLSEKGVDQNIIEGLLKDFDGI